MMRKIFFLVFFCFNSLTIVDAQHFNANEFEEKVAQAAKLLIFQPVPKHVTEFLMDGFKLDSIEEFKYHLSDPQGNPITAVLHIKTLKIVYVEFTQSNATFADVKQFLVKRKFEWVGSEHLWNYFNDKRFAIGISPGMMVHVSMYGH